ncbi:MAG: DUF1194 domain-containing protein [Pseudomonadota bacterium]
MRFVLGIVIACAATLATVAKATEVETWLVLMVDRSGSIDDDELGLQRSAYVEILGDPEIGATFAGARVAIIEFDTRAELVVDWSTFAVAAQRYAAYAPAAPRGGTAIGGGLQLALSLLADRPGHRIVDVSGDGRDNRDQILLADMRARARREGVEINGLVFESRSSDRVARYFEERVITGFVVTIDDLNDFADALRRKLRLELQLAGLDRSEITGAGHPLRPDE